MIIPLVALTVLFTTCVTGQKIKVSLNNINSEIIDIKWCGSQT